MKVTARCTYPSSYREYKSTMTGTDDDEYSLSGILDGTKYPSGNLVATESEEEEFRTDPTFGSQSQLQ